MCNDAKGNLNKCEIGHEKRRAVALTTSSGFLSSSIGFEESKNLYSLHAFTRGNRLRYNKFLKTSFVASKLQGIILNNAITE